MFRLNKRGSTLGHLRIVHGDYSQPNLLVHTLTHSLTHSICVAGSHMIIMKTRSGHINYCQVSKNPIVSDSVTHLLYWVLFSCQIKISFKYNLKSIDLSSFLNYVFLEFEFILFLLRSTICNHGVTLAVLFLYPVTTKDTCIFILSLFLNFYSFVYLEVINKINKYTMHLDYNSHASFRPPVRVSPATATSCKY